MRVFDLSPANGRKSFYGKAKVKQSEKETILQSYNTEVCKLVNGRFVRLWGDYSSTTLNHINAFRTLYGLPCMNKKEWIETEVNSNEI